MFSYELFLFVLYCLAFVRGQVDGDKSHNWKVGQSIRIEFTADQKKITVDGWRNASWSGKEYFSFRGLPFAQPPVGQLRFRDPLPMKEFPSYTDARNDGRDCFGVNEEFPSEDCLTLSVYTRSVNASDNLPVLFFIHGGSFLSGSGISWDAQPKYLLSKPIVLVAINYRLAAFGFLGVGTREIPGNAGLKDQVVALRWVRKYIKYFGGNPKDVTIMGYSAGAACVGLHLVSPMSQGLFHKAILMSGAHPFHTPIPKYEQLEFSRRQAKALNCQAANSIAEIVKCVQAASGKQLIASIQKLYTIGDQNPIFQYKPMIERDYGQERFLTENPLDSMRRGAFAKVPILTGFADGEMCSLAVGIYQDPVTRKQFSEQFNKVAPQLFLYDNVDRNVSAINKALKDHYFPNFKGLNEQNLNNLCDMFSETYIRFGDQLIAELAAPYTKVFEYKFDYLGDFSSQTFPLKPPRVEHGDDLAYLFGSTNPKFTLTNSTKQMIHLYTKFMNHFVQKGAQLAANVTTYPKGYTRINKVLEQKSGTALDKDTFDLWKRLFL